MSLILLLIAPAHAFLYGGNPAVRLDVQRASADLVSGDVDLTKLRVHYCSGGFADYTVGQTIDPVAGFTQVISGGDICDLRFYWGSDMMLDGSGSLGSFSLLYGEAYTTVPVDPAIAIVPLTPFELVSGSMTSGAPGLRVTIE